MLSKLLADQIDATVKAMVNEAGQSWPDGLAVKIEQPAHLEHGDFATNIAMQLAKVLRKPPVNIAENIKERLERDGRDGSFEGLVAKMEVAPPGFINFYIDWSIWAEKRLYAATPDGKRSGTKVVVEHTSINPNKSAHIGHLRNSCIGDSLARLLRKTGYHVEVHNYIDDLGNQLADTVVGVLNTAVSNRYARFGDFCWDVYAEVNRKYKDNPGLMSERTKVLHALEEGAGRTAWLGMLVAERIVHEHLTEMAQFGIGYDVLIWESSIVREGFWDAAFALLKRSPLFYQEREGRLAGCWVLKQPGSEPSDAGEADGEYDQDKVLVRSNGILTYTAKDIAYHLWKFGLLGKDFKYRKFSGGLWSTAPDGVRKRFGQADKVVNVIDHRQEYPQAMVKLSLQALGFHDQASNLHHIGYGVVSLSPATAEQLGIDTSDNKKSYAMSGRQGIGIKIADLLERMEAIIDRKRTRKSGISSRRIAAASIRYYLLKFGLQTEIVFDLQQATEISGNTGVYLLYAHARAASILKKAQEDGIIPGTRRTPDSPGTIPGLEKPEYALLRHIANWPETLHAAAHELSPNIVCNYAYELATLFNNFYAACPILKAGNDRRRFRLWLTEVYKQTLAEALDVLGLPKPNRM